MCRYKFWSMNVHPCIVYVHVWSWVYVCVLHTLYYGTVLSLISMYVAHTRPCRSVASWLWLTNVHYSSAANMLHPPTHRWHLKVSVVLYSWACIIVWIWNNVVLKFTLISFTIFFHNSLGTLERQHFLFTVLALVWFVIEFTWMFQVSCNLL